MEMALEIQAKGQDPAEYQLSSYGVPFLRQAGG
jgi:hypothetical protein